MQLPIVVKQSDVYSREVTLKLFHNDVVLRIIYLSSNLIDDSLPAWGALGSMPLADAAAVCDEAKFDEVAGKLLLYANDELQPETPEGLVKTCQNDNKTFDWMEDYTKGCIKGIAGGLYLLWNILLFSDLESSSLRRFEDESSRRSRKREWSCRNPH